MYVYLYGVEGVPLVGPLVAHLPWEQKEKGTHDLSNESPKSKHNTLKPYTLKLTRVNPRAAPIILGCSSRGNTKGGVLPW